MVDEMDAAEQQQQDEQRWFVSEDKMDIAAEMERQALVGAAAQRASVASGSSDGRSSSDDDYSSDTDSGAVPSIPGGLVGNLCPPSKRVRNEVDRFEAGPASGKRGTAASPSRGGGSRSDPYCVTW